MVTPRISIKIDTKKHILRCDFTKSDIFETMLNYGRASKKRSLIHFLLHFSEFPYSENVKIYIFLLKLGAPFKG